MRRGIDREWDRALRIQTQGREDETGGPCMPYEPTPYAVLERLAASGLVRPEDRVLDCGCGKGRVAFFLSDRVGCRVTGIDHSEKLIAMAEANRASFAHAERVRFLCARAEALPVGPENVFYFFNPFSANVLRRVLRRLSASLPGELRLLFYFPTEAYLDCLAELPELVQTGEIDCRDLFGDDGRERVAAFTLART